MAQGTQKDQDKNRPESGQGQSGERGGQQSGSGRTGSGQDVGRERDKDRNIGQPGRESGKSGQGSEHDIEKEDTGMGSGA